MLAGGHKPAGIFQREHPSQVGGQHLAVAVAHQQIRPHTPALPKLAEGISHRKQCGLAGPRLIQQSLNPVKSLAEGGVSQQLLAHPQGLGALTGKQPGQLARPP